MPAPASGALNNNILPGHKVGKLLSNSLNRSLPVLIDIEAEDPGKVLLRQNYIAAYREFALEMALQNSVDQFLSDALVTGLLLASNCKDIRSGNEELPE